MPRQILSLIPSAPEAANLQHREMSKRIFELDVLRGFAI
jgi:uncharacterized membrane protein YeiB